MQHRITQAQYQEVFANIDICNALFPQAFPKRGGAQVKPLKVGIAKELQSALQAAGHEVSMKAIRRLLTYWCSRNFYLKSFKNAASRIDLAGEPAGEITEEQRSIAKTTLTDRANRLQAKQEVRIEASESVAQKAI